MFTPEYGIRTITPEENCLLVRFRIWVSVTVIFKIGEIFLGGNCKRKTLEEIIFIHVLQ